MAKLGENTPHIIDATVDFMASSQAFREYLKDNYDSLHNPESISLEDLIEASMKYTPICNEASLRYELAR